jgi:hypothetical protein
MKYWLILLLMVFFHPLFASELSLLNYSAPFIAQSGHMHSSEVKEDKNQNLRNEQKQKDEDSDDDSDEQDSNDDDSSNDDNDEQKLYSS